LGVGVSSIVLARLIDCNNRGGQDLVRRVT
jgi:hypothetical protein